jgi:DNA-binding transcriptional ArsR family regulator
LHELNELGDLEIRDPSTMRALAHPTRLSIFEWLQRHGAATAGRLATEVETTPAEADAHLRELLSFELVVQDDDGWRTVAKGIRFEPSDDAESQAAYRALANEMFRRSDDVPRRWLAEHEPQLEPGWRQVSGLSGARTLLTRSEAEALDLKMEELLVPYVTRGPSEAPDGARPVRLLRYLLPERLS